LSIAGLSMTRRAVLQEDLLSSLKGFGRCCVRINRLVKVLDVSGERGQVRLRQAAPRWHCCPTFSIPKNLAQKAQREPSGYKVLWFAQQHLAYETITTSCGAMASGTVLFE